MCEYCNTKYFVQMKRFTKPLLAPLTEVEELSNKLIDLTGIEYLQIPINYCPMCGRDLKRRNNTDE